MYINFFEVNAFAPNYFMIVFWYESLLSLYMDRAICFTFTVVIVSTDVC